jgi:hypothetical protein
MGTPNRWLRLGALGLLALLVLAGPVQAQDAGILSGRVANGTAGGPEVGRGVSVLLHVFLGEAEIETLETTTDAGGGFRFEGLDTNTAIEYWPEVVYLGVSYGPDEPSQFGAGQTELEATLTVFETTDDDSALVVDSVHIIAESFGEVLRISEIQLYGNTGDRTFVGTTAGERRSTVTIPLPENAVGVAFQEDASDQRLVEAEGQLIDSEPVPPGQETSLVFFSYHLMVTGDSVPLERTFVYPVTVLNVLVAQPGLTLESEQLQSRGMELFQSRQYEFYTGQGFGPDEPLQVELLPVAGETGGQAMPGVSEGGSASATVPVTGGSQGTLLWIGVVLAFLFAAAALVYPSLARRPTRASAAAQAAAPAARLTSDPEARRLLAELADLEDAREAGDLEDAAYEQRRAELYEALRAQ